MAMGAGLRPIAKVVDKPPDPNVRAPVLDPTVMHTLAVTEVSCRFSSLSTLEWYAKSHRVPNPRLTNMEQTCGTFLLASCPAIL